MARVIAAKSGLRNDIVRYNNSQNAVRIWTVRAADDIKTASTGPDEGRTSVCPKAVRLATQT